MSKVSLWGLLLLFILGFSAADAAENPLSFVADGTPSMIVGNAKNKSVKYLPASSVDTARVALYYPSTFMRAFQGCSITELHVDVSGKTGKDSLSVFITDNLQRETPLYQQRATATGAGWQTIQLEQPFLIDGSPLYIGYEVQGVRYLRYSETLVSGEEWVFNNSQGWRKYDESDVYSSSFYMVVSGDHLPQNNIVLQHTVIPRYVEVNHPMTVSGTFFNYGMQPVESLTVSFLVDGQEMGTRTVSQLSTAHREMGSFVCESPSFLEQGSSDFTMLVTQVNGAEDADTSDNSSRHVSLLCLPHFEKRNILLEVFSTELCTNCPGGHQVITQVLGEKEDVIEVDHHAGFYQDDFTIQASKDYEWFYHPVYLFAPAVMMDRTALADNYPQYFEHGVPVVSPTQEALSAMYAAQSSTPAFAHIQLQNTLDAAERTLSLHVVADAIEGMPLPDSVRLTVFLTEDSIFTLKQAGSLNNFYHRHCIRQCVTPTWGVPVDLSGAEGFSADYQVTLPAEWNVEKMKAVAFLSAYNPEDKNDCMVLNSVQAGLTENGSSGIRQLEEVSPLNSKRRLITLEGEIRLPASAARIDIYNLSGRQVARLNSASPVAILPRGVYIVK